MNLIKLFGIACCRFRHRHGYGIHSPIDFNLITGVIYGSYHYYAYEDLRQLRRQVTRNAPSCTRKVDERLFRLVNLYQPECMVEVGTGTGLSACYMSAAKKGARCVTIETEYREEEPVVLNKFPITYVKATDSRSLLQDFQTIGLLHIAHTQRYEEVFEEALLHVSPQSLFIVENIHESKAKKEWWKRVVADERTGVTFDLYESGLVYFDLSRPKQNYVS